MAAKAAMDESLTHHCAGRPEIDLETGAGLQVVVDEFKPDVIVNAAAYTAVDKAEEEIEISRAVNAGGPRRLAREAQRIGVPLIHVSTDYVFDGEKPTSYLETDPTSPLGVYGRTKLEGEQSIAEEMENFVILRTAWVFSPFGKNFVKTMMRLASDRDEVSVVADQHGTPTSALDIADGVLTIARNLYSGRVGPDGYDVFHMTSSGEAVWADFAEEVFKVSQSKGGPSARVKRISTAEFPTPAKRPKNSRLNCEKLAKIHNVEFPDWRESVATCVDAILTNGKW